MCFFAGDGETKGLWMECENRCTLIQVCLRKTMLRLDDPDRRPFSIRCVIQFLFSNIFLNFLKLNWNFLKNAKVPADR
ncbi:hypothetical protein ES288_A12G123300v1 [Gossypium darwinii]|uniref:Uncharacterized protein n=1 Tax=Gossypium darwinii TaxID=34276 RepID=A0A5D2E8B2_GOSDA|nr:hypothetical protein ES288_A12G123300v1 [Gossypium darwinii]